MGSALFSKKAQVTIFVILGIILAISSALIFYIKGINVPEPKVDQVKKSEIEIYTSECLKAKAEEAISLIGIQGGYVKHNSEDVLAISAAVSAMRTKPGSVQSEEEQAASVAMIQNLNSFESGYLSMYSGKLLLPYWYYQDEFGFDQTKMPLLYKSYDGDDSIQSQIETYVLENLGSCINSYEPFKDEGYTVKIQSAPVIQVLFTDSRVVVEMNYPVVLELNGLTERYETFSAEIPVRLKRIYELAKEIRDYEATDVFLERQTKNFITAYSAVDKNYLPPMYGGMTFESCSNRVYWLYPDVSENFKTMLSANIPYLKVENTDYTPVTITEKEAPDKSDRAIMQGIMKGHVINISQTSNPFIKVDFSYDYNFPTELDLGGKGILEPNSFDVDLLFSKFCMFEYKFFYNTRFPVLVTLTDSKSNIENSPYIFQFPLEVIIKDNFPRIRYSDVFGTPEERERSLQCSENQRQAGPVNITVKDTNGAAVENARVLFQCGPTMVYQYDTNGSITNASRFADRCFMGLTDKNGRVDMNFPPCLGGGVITVEHDSYLGTTDLVGSVLRGKPISRNYTLSKVVEKDIVISKFFVKPPIVTGTNMVDNLPGIVLSGEDVVGCNIRSDAVPLQEHENVLVKLTRISDDNGIMPSQPFVLYNPTNKNVLKLAPGRYNVDLLLLRNERYKGEMTILADSEFKYIPGSIASSAQTIYYPEENVEIPTTFSGGSDFVWELKPEDLYSSGKIRFYIIDEGMPKFIEHVGRAVNDRKNCTALNYGLMQPTFE
jgi:hypothetical protein